MKTTSVKQFRQNMAQYADEIEKGEIIVVYRRSKASFKVVPIETEIEEKWETVIDFTEKGKKKGVSVDDAVTALETMDDG